MPYNIAFLSRFPPLEGGIAAKTYWLASGLAKRGHNVHIITHPISVGKEYNVQGCECIPLEMPNLHIHRPPDEMPWHLPEDNEYSLALLDLTIKVIRNHGIQILDSGYLIPYGILGNLVKHVTGVPHITRHGGSDLEKFLKKNLLSNVIKEAITDANMVITDKVNQGLFESMTSRVVCHPPYVPNDQVFASCGHLVPQWRLAAIGKVNYHWQHKGLNHIVEIMREMPPQFECLMVGQGKGMSDFRCQMGAEPTSRIKWCPFIFPWDMPSLLHKLDAVFIFETFLPHPVFSNLAMEALSAGVGIVTDQANFTETYTDIVKADEHQVLVVSPLDHLQSANAIAQWVRTRTLAANTPYQRISYQDHLLALEETYEVVLASKA